MVPVAVGSAEGLQVRRSLPGASQDKCRAEEPAARAARRVAGALSLPASRSPHDRAACTAASRDGVDEALRRPRDGRSRKARRCARSTEVDLDVDAGRDARARRRVGLRQVDARPHAPAALRADRRHDHVRRRRRHAHVAARAAAAAPQDADDLPGSVRVAQPAHDDRRGDRRAARDPRARAVEGRARGARAASCSRRSASAPTRRRATRTSSPAASGSASASRARSRSSRGSSCATSRSARSTSRSRRRSSTCCRICRRPRS